MNFEVISRQLKEISTDGILLVAFEGKEKPVLTRAFSGLDPQTLELINEAIDRDQFLGKEGQLLTVFTPKRALAKRILLMGLGKKDEFSHNTLRKTLAVLVKHVRTKMISITIPLLHETDHKIDYALQAQMVGEGLLLGSYTFIKYKKNEEAQKELDTVTFVEINKNSALKIKEGIKRARLYTDATKIARDLVNEPAAVVTPTYLAKLAQDIAKKNPEISCKVYDRASLEKMGMGALLGVAQAAETPPKFIHLQYSPKIKSDRKRKLAIVGKGITFDSGGINVKTGDHMQTMKMDMSGAAAVLGVFSVISQIKPTFSVMGLIAATPNLISGTSLVPGDVVKAFNGKTIEVLNTDAEGRVTLADSLSYAVKEEATEIIDLATLTGACMVALGTDIAGLFSNNRKLAEEFIKASRVTGERMWELPLTKEYKTMNKSEVADIANIPSSRYGGAITGALFLQEFVDNKPWIHVDIAGPAFMEKSYELGPKGATGFGVRTLLEYMRGLSE